MIHYVYIIQSVNYPDHYYLGYTTNLKNRLAIHHSETTVNTLKYKPWKIKNTISFNEKEKALAFEKYLKSHSGGAFAKSISDIQVIGSYLLLSLNYT